MGRSTKISSKSAKQPNRRDLFRRLADSELLFLLETAEFETQRVVSHELGRRRSKGAIPLLIHRLATADLKLREAAADALGMIGDQAAGPALLDLFADTAQPVQIRDTCAYALARLAFKPALPKLIAGLMDPSPTVRCCVVAALAAIGESEARQMVEIVYATERNEEVKKAMRDLLDELPASTPLKFPAKSETENRQNDLRAVPGMMYAETHAHGSHYKFHQAQRNPEHIPFQLLEHIAKGMILTGLPPSFLLEQLPEYTNVRGSGVRPPFPSQQLDLTGISKMQTPASFAAVARQHEALRLREAGDKLE
jgi:hypothetical protein